MKIRLLIALLYISGISCAQKIKVPAVHSNIKNNNGALYVEIDGQQVYEVEYQNPYTLSNLRGKIAGTGNGLFFDFNDDSFKGKLIYGFIPFGDSKYPHPVFYNRSAHILTGKVAINISQQLRGRYDMIDWEKNKKGTVGYRVIGETGNMLFDGIISFKGAGPFKVDDTILEGPFINLLQSDGATVSFETNNEIIASVTVDGKEYKSVQSGKHHEILISGLEASKKYDYSVTYGQNTQTYSRSCL